MRKDLLPDEYLAEGMPTTLASLPVREFLSGPISGIFVGLINEKYSKRERETTIFANTCSP